MEQRSVSAHPGSHAGLVSLGVGQYPPRWCVLVGQQVDAGSDRGRDPRLGLVVRHGNVDVDTISLRAWRVHLLEPERRSTAARVDQVLGPHVPISEHGAPERLHLGTGERIDRDLNGLYGGRVGGHV